MAFRFHDYSVCCLLHGPAVIIRALGSVCFSSWFLHTFNFFIFKNLSVTQNNATFQEDVTTTRIDVYKTLCPQQMLVHKGGKINNVQLITGVGSAEMSHLQNSMVLSTWNSVYALQWQCMKTICFCYVRHPMHLLVLFAIPKSIFSRQDRLNRLKQC